MKIETDIPVPMSTRSRKYPFLDMQVGESIWFDEPVNGRAYRSALSTGTRHGLKFVTRREHSGIRIWRSEYQLGHSQNNCGRSISKGAGRMTLREELEGQVFMIAQALVASGKHTNRYKLAREALETAIAVKDEVEKYLSHLLAEEYLEGLDLDQEEREEETGEDFCQACEDGTCSELTTEEEA